MYKQGFKLFLTGLLICGLQNCGKLSTNSDNPKAQSNSKLQSIKKYAYYLEYDNHEPPELGQKWQRTITFYQKGTPIANVVVEARRQDQQEFFFVGLTDKNGSVFDEDVTKHTQYRIGQKLLSTWQVGRRDFIWKTETTNDEIKKNFAGLNKAPVVETVVSKKDLEPFELVADRIVISADQIASWNSKAPLTIKSQKLIIDGKLMAFHESCRSGDSAPALEVSTLEITGKGLIDWAGCQGQTGSQGAAGTNGRKGDQSSSGNGGKGGTGQKGGTGGNGGNGGNLHVKAKFFDFKVHQLMSSGGAAGIGGRGGPGGKGGSYGQYYVRIGTRMSGFEVESKYGKNGKNGAAGPQGAPGNVGSPGEIKVTVDNFIHHSETREDQGKQELQGESI